MGQLKHVKEGWHNGYLVNSFHDCPILDDCLWICTHMGRIDMEDSLCRLRHEWVGANSHAARDKFHIRKIERGRTLSGCAACRASVASCRICSLLVGVHILVPNALLIHRMALPIYIPYRYCCTEIYIPDHIAHKLLPSLHPGLWNKRYRSSLTLILEMIDWVVSITKFSGIFLIGDWVPFAIGGPWGSFDGRIISLPLSQPKIAVIARQTGRVTTTKSSYSTISRRHRPASSVQDSSNIA